MKNSTSISPSIAQLAERWTVAVYCWYIAGIHSFRMVRLRLDGRCWYPSMKNSTSISPSTAQLAERWTVAVYCWYP
ncbi:hypothetical protein CEXT_698091 [Caerostris extrusa]|uniref:Uncharacterized protein n=1 Tax=Caerostris extrusa TaxID=172846 RepID=A0AAV4UKM6_CAEEX|nr:hypothetical protein CEXT_698091 [Caerostris extrusa]